MPSHKGYSRHHSRSPGVDFEPATRTLELNDEKWEILDDLIPEPRRSIA